jgi:carbon storage regulator
MLVLRRHEQEAIVIDGRIKIIVVDIQPDAVRLGFEAPNHVVIDREEIYLRKQQQEDSGGDD